MVRSIANQRMISPLVLDTERIQDKNSSVGIPTRRQRERENTKKEIATKRGEKKSI
jgi:hypothetical protein